ncbi:hypothetical protein FF098_010165 [Parvularcula flava]|uniref:Uncharacterized protein n=1 Tax=Aquisalinus luteolus TaxID=1566827 RepID=A0A8J3ERA7_9PROT|nr:hypothetical protein [Aquisalinus luteolus]NHK28269.1 hypothetical protein [Aquisalinus luteolus]GGH97973.1 hypothetical protein GCM10011355_20470 [Aquisalinus luteolus]
MAGTKTAFCVGALALAVCATGNAIEPRLAATPAQQGSSRNLTIETVKASSAQLTGQMIAPYLTESAAKE